MAANECTDYGPLTGLIGTWQGSRGVDKAPAPDGLADCPYFETLCFEACDRVTNAQSQTLAVLHYRQVVSRLSDNQVFHHETGY